MVYFEFLYYYGLLNKLKILAFKDGDALNIIIYKVLIIIG